HDATVLVADFGGGTSDFSVMRFERSGGTLRAEPLGHAGVGIGTLYRHFPTREALYEAVYRREVEQLGDLAEQLQNAPEPVEALRRWLRANVQ
ncbi:TetR family transcriptional regulator, partial [Stenotrophomonas maltophilia]|uniref:TetR/AcrR family transcriptional regulator n=1 Tax=Stenotrophomonas maltophilia TaxID=40324 RepID=UPI003F6DA577